jgi:hypothetical protein
MAKWAVGADPAVRDWLHNFRTTDRRTLSLISAAIDHVVRGKGPAEGRPLVDRVSGSKIHNLKELRPASAGGSEVRILFVFDQDQRMVLLVGGDKAGEWKEWYETSIPLAETRYDAYVDQVRRRGS